MKRNIKYIFAFCALLGLEIFIALYVHDAFVRPYVGDMLVVILMYTFIRGLVKKPIKFLPIYLFIFSSAVEISQYFQLVSILKLEKHRLISTIIGNSFDIKDILCYFVGTLVLMVWEYIENRKRPNKT